jgi:hypothetical protein
LPGVKLEDISGIARLTNLPVLTLHNTKVKDFSVLAGLPYLVKFSLARTVEDVNKLAGLANLLELNLTSTETGWWYIRNRSRAVNNFESARRVQLVLDQQSSVAVVRRLPVKVLVVHADPQ